MTGTHHGHLSKTNRPQRKNTLKGTGAEEEPHRYQVVSPEARSRDMGQQAETEIRERRTLHSQEAERHTVADLVDRYKKEIEGDAAKEKAGQPRQLDWFGTEIGNLSLAELTPAVLAGCRDKLASEKSNPTSTR